MIRLSAQKLQTDLVVWQSYADSRATWFHLEGLGRLLLRLGHPDASRVLQQAAVDYQRSPAQSSDDLLYLGHLYHMAGDEDQAITLWNQVYQQSQQSLRSSADPDLDDLAPLVQSCYLLRRYDEATSQFQRITDVNDTRYYPPPTYILAAQLAASYLARDANTLTVSVAQTTQWIKRYRIRIMDTGLTFWDWYDLALATTREIAPDIAASLEPVRVPGVTLLESPSSLSSQQAALQRLSAYNVMRCEWVYYVWNTQDEIGFQQIVFTDGTVVIAEEIDDLELLESLWDCIDLALNDHRVHLQIGCYQLDVAQHTIRRVAEVLDGREWEEDAEPTSLAEMVIRPLPEEEQLVVDVLDV